MPNLRFGTCELTERSGWSGFLGWNTCLFQSRCCTICSHGTKTNEASKIDNAFKFFEEMAGSEDPLVCEVLEFSVIESFISKDKKVLAKCKTFMRPKTLSCCEVIEQWFIIELSL